MAGRGPAPKPADQRRNRNKKERGEWQGILAPSARSPRCPNVASSGRVERRTRRAAVRLVVRSRVDAGGSPSDMNLLSILRM